MSKKTVGIALAVIVLAVVLAAAKLSSVYNDLVAQREDINGAWSQVEVVLQRRADLIPNLVETVKGFAAQERSVIEAVANARAALIGARGPAEKIEANARLDTALGRLLLVVENYPNLKSNENFLRLQDELAGSENRIAQERRKYNEKVQKYNTSIALFPNNLAAGLFHFQRNDAYFRTEPAARAAPKVSFGQPQ
jgi:LemA protein